jgi:hypothetical protein
LIFSPAQLARDRFGEALRVADLTDEDIAEEMEVYDQLKGGKRETQKAKRPGEPRLYGKKQTSLNASIKRW